MDDFFRAMAKIEALKQMEGDWPNNRKGDATMGKQFKDAAAAARPVYSTIIGSAQNVEDVKGVLNAQNVKAGRNAKYTGPMERLNLKIPAELKAYLQAAAYRASSPTRTVSPTEYLCKLLREDMEKHNADGDSL